MTLTQEKLDELEMIESIYPEKITVDNHDLVNCQDCATDPEKMPILRFNITFDQVHVAVLLPSAYPKSAPAEFRITWCSLSSNDESKFNALVKHVISVNEGECVVHTIMAEAIEFLSSLQENTHQTNISIESVEDCPLPYSRVWYYAHHIYSREKRTNMLQWSKELCLNGLVLPGKPGIICIEGIISNCKEFNSRVRAMNWQLLKLQHEEPALSSADLKFNDFKELIFDVHGRANNHQDLGQFRTFLASLNMENVFQILFNI